MHFEDRKQAGIALAKELMGYSGENTLILGIPGGGVVVGAPIAEALGAPLHFVQVDPVARAGRRRAATQRMRSGGARSMFGGTASNEASERSGSDVASATMPEVEGRTVIVVDDGLHDDLEVHRTLIAFRGRGATKLILASPFLFASTADRHGSEVDAVVTLHRFADLSDAVEYYDDSTSPSIDEVRALLTADTVEVAEVTEDSSAIYQNILVPVDFSDPSIRAVREALRLQRAGGGLVTLFHIAPALPGYGEDAEAAAVRRQQPLITFAQGLIPDGADVYLKVGLGEPAAQILSQVIHGDHDLIIMGTNGRRGLPRALFGSVAEQVIRASVAPVLVTH